MIIGRRELLGTASLIGGGLALGAGSPGWAIDAVSSGDLRDAVAGRRVFYAGTALHVPFLERVGHARAAGMDGVSIFTAEWQALIDGGMAPAEVRRRLDDAGVMLTDYEGIMNWIPDRAPAADPKMAAQMARLTPEAILPMAAAAGARAVLVGDMNPEPADLDRAAEGFSRLCDLAAEYGLRAELEFMPFGGIPDLAAGWEVVRRAGQPNGGLLIDSWHFFRSNSSLELLAEIPGEKIIAVQLNDGPATAEPDLLTETMHRRRLPGAGDFALDALLAVLDRIDFRGPVGIETYSDDFAALGGAEIARRSADALDRAIRSHQTGAGKPRA